MYVKFMWPYNKFFCLVLCRWHTSISQLQYQWLIFSYWSNNQDLSEINNYASTHNINLNCSKFKCLIICNKSIKDNIKLNLILKISDNTIPVVDELKILSLIIHGNLRFDKHLNNLLKCIYATLIYSNKQILANKVTRATVCQSHVISKILNAIPVYFPFLAVRNFNGVQIF